MHVRSLIKVYSYIGCYIFYKAQNDHDMLAPACSTLDATAIAVCMVFKLSELRFRAQFIGWIFKKGLIKMRNR